MEFRIIVLERTPDKYRFILHNSKLIGRLYNKNLRNTAIENNIKYNNNIIICALVRGCCRAEVNDCESVMSTKSKVNICLN